MKITIKKVFLIIILFLLLGLFMIINLYSTLSSSDNIDMTTTTTTKKKTDDTIDKIKNIILYIEGIEEEVSVKTYKSHLGFKIDYDIDHFEANRLSNGSVMLTNIYNSDIYVKVEKISVDEYNNSYGNIVNEEVINGYKYTYKYFTDSKIYVKITKCILDNTEYDGLNIRMDYMVDSISFN